MKIIFLDIDGVITSLRTGWFNFDIYAIHYLRWICKETNSKIVISNTWRANHNKDFWKSIFGEYIHDDYRTPLWYEFKPKPKYDICRGHEIKLWLDKHNNIEDYIILDDDSDMLDEQMSRLIKTDSFNGLMAKNIEEIRNVFNIKSYQNEDNEIYIHPNMFSFSRK